MRVAHSQIMRDAERRAIALGVSEAALMEAAGRGIAAAIRRLHPSPGRCVVWAGKGHNGGDALVAARLLAALGWEIVLADGSPPATAAPLTRLHRDALDALSGPRTGAVEAGRPDVVLDGLLGVGARGGLREPVRSAAHAIRTLRDRGAKVVAVDLPSGLDPDSGEGVEGGVVADLTVAVGLVKAGLIADPAQAWTGAIETVALPGIEAPDETGPVLLDRAELAPWLDRRALTTHKSTAGRVGIVAGSPGFAGAARLAALGALRGGAGLVTLFVPESIGDQVAAAVAPEIMVRAGPEPASAALEARLDVLAIGPGLSMGPETRQAVYRLLERFPGPMVVDADALTLAADRPELWSDPPGPRVLTPHPGEMERLLPRPAGADRARWAEGWIRRFPRTVLLLKGVRTLVATAGQPLLVNSTGNPGMASGGMGDLLTGLVAAQMAAGAGPRESAALAAWIHGRAADRCLWSGAQSEESLVASDVAAHFGGAFEDLRQPLE